MAKRRRPFEGSPQFDAVADSGERQLFSTGSVRDTHDGKGRFDLIPFYPLFRLARHYENGAVKYGDRNWQKGQPLSRYLDSAARHIWRLIDGAVEEDHAAAAAWNLFGFLWTAHKIMAGELPAELNDLPESMQGIVQACKE
jgi:hypothetical protein